MSEPETSTAVEAAFEILDWDEDSYDEPDAGPKLGHVTITKRYQGVIEGRGVAHVLSVQGPDGGGYVASERITGTLEGREGSFVIQHGGLADASGQSTYGTVIAGSGTADLVGIAGRAVEAREGVLTLEYTLPAAPA